jgi:plastocyanin
VAVLTVVTAVVVAGCGTPGTKLHVSGTGTARPGEASASATAQPAADGVQQIVIDAVDGEHFKPDAIYARTGKLRVTITNESVLPHNFTVPSLGVQSATIFAGHSISVSLDLKSGGVYPFLCTFHQHDGMTGQLIVTAG